jgi:hypothetical protein
VTKITFAAASTSLLHFSVRRCDMCGLTTEMSVGLARDHFDRAARHPARHRRPRDFQSTSRQGSPPSLMTAGTRWSWRRRSISAGVWSPDTRGFGGVNLPPRLDFEFWAPASSAGRTRRFPVGASDKTQLRLARAIRLTALGAQLSITAFVALLSADLASEVDPRHPALAFGAVGGTMNDDRSVVQRRRLLPSRRRKSTSACSFGARFARLA